MGLPMLVAVETWENENSQLSFGIYSTLRLPISIYLAPFYYTKRKKEKIYLATFLILLSYLVPIYSSLFFPNIFFNNNLYFGQIYVTAKCDHLSRKNQGKESRGRRCRYGFIRKKWDCFCPLLTKGVVKSFLEYIFFIFIQKKKNCTFYFC